MNKPSDFPAQPPAAPAPAAASVPTLPLTALPTSPDAGGLREYSVVYTDRAMNHMAQRFQAALRGMLERLKRVHGAAAAVVMPGSGTFGMEAVARQFATGQKVLVVRLGWFSYRWSQIFEAGGIVAAETVLKARRVGQAGVTDADQQPFAPPPIEEVEATIARERPQLVFAPHVETASGILLPDEHVRRLADAVHAVGGLMVLDGIASGCVWIDMQALGVDVLVSAPQKVWSGSPGCAFVMLSSRAVERLAATRSTSFAADLKRWHQIMQAYEGGGHAYHATMPTDALLRTEAAMQEAERIGLERLRQAQWTLGRGVRALLAQHGFPSVAAPGFEAPGVVVAYTRDEAIHTGRAFLPLGLQTAAGVPLQCDEGPGYRSFRLGLFGLDKLSDPDASIGTLRAVFETLPRG